MSKQVELTVIVNGQPTVVKAFVDDPLGSIVSEALRQTGHSGQPAENWELRDAEGNRLDEAKKIRDFDFTEKTHLYLSLKAGVGGDD